jgi:hypothetical protein
MGCTKEAKWVFGRDIESGKYKYDELIIVGYQCGNLLYDGIKNKVYRLR